MDELGLHLEAMRPVFVTVSDNSYLLVEVPPTQAEQLAERLKVAVRRCYVDDATLDERHRATGLPRTDLVRMKLPDPGSVMSGDFGEILTAVFQALQELPVPVIDPKKWRLKQDRTKAAPHSDIVQFVLPDWDTTGPSDRDRLLCTEVKAKATSSSTNDPVADAIRDSRLDEERRLVKTLGWLKERAVFGDLNTMSVKQIERFLDEAVDCPPAERVFRAVVVISSDLASDAIDTIDPQSLMNRALVIIQVPKLKESYEAVYEAVIASADKGWTES